MQHDSADTLEWRPQAGGATRTSLAAKIRKIEVVSAGLFGVLNSPSIEPGPREPVWVTLEIADGSLNKPASPRRVKMKMLKGELNDQYVGDRVLLDMIDERTCIGVRTAPAAQ